MLIRVKKKILSLPHLYEKMGLGVLLFILILRIKIGINRAFDPDEFIHMHASFFVSQGKIPYKDFFTVYSPILYLTLAPLIKITGESFSFLIICRLFIALVNSISFYFIYKIGSLDKKYIGLLSAIIAASLPLIIEKNIEVRTDNLMMMFFLAGVYYSLLAIKFDRKSDFIKAGLLFSLSTWTLIKIVPILLAFVLSLMIFIRLKYKQKNLVLGLKYFIISYLTVSFLIFSIIWLMGILKEFTEFVFIGSISIALNFVQRGNFWHWLLPNTGVFANSPLFMWYVNTFFILIGIVGLLSTFFGNNEKQKFHSLLILPLFVSLIYLEVFVPTPFQQYLIPFLVLFSFFISRGIIFIGNQFGRYKKVFSFALFVFIFGLLSSSVYQFSELTVAKKNNEDDRKFIEYVVKNTKKSDVFWGGDQKYIFRNDGYLIYDGVWEFPSSYYKKFPIVISSLEKNNTKYIVAPKINPNFDDSFIPFNLPNARGYSTYVKDNFHPTNFDYIWVRN